MRAMKRNMIVSYQDRLLFCFIAGILAGTAAANLLGGELKQQIGYFDTLFLSGQGMDFGRQKEMWLYVLRQRGLELTGAWLLSLTVFSSAGFCLLAGLAGGSIAVALSVITVQKGLSGLLFYMATVLPQALFYVPAGLILASWAGEEQHRIRIPALVLLVVLLLAGSVSETWVSPRLIGFFLS